MNTAKNSVTRNNYNNIIVKITILSQFQIELWVYKD